MRLISDRGDLMDHSTETAPVIRIGMPRNARRNAEWVALYEGGLSTVQISKMKDVKQSTVASVIARYADVRPGRKNGRDLTGQRFGFLVAIECVGRRNGSRERYWRCDCDCGGTITTRRSCLVDSQTRSCGCLKRGPKKKAA